MFILKILQHVQTQIHFKISTFMSDIVQPSLKDVDITSCVGWSKFILLAVDFKLNITCPDSVVFRLLWWPNDSHVQNNEPVHLTSAQAAHWLIWRSSALLTGQSCSNVWSTVKLNLTKLQQSDRKEQETLCCGCLRWNTAESKSYRNTSAASSSTERPSNSHLLERFPKLASFTQTSTFFCALSM